MACTIREYELYFRFVNTHIPDLLRNLYATYPHFYVKGGKAVDTYLNKKIGSPDWDISYYYRKPKEIEDVHARIMELLHAFLSTFTNSSATIVFERAKYNQPGKPELDMIQYGIEQGGCRLLFLDVVFQQGVVPDPTVMMGIPFQRLGNLKTNMNVLTTNRNQQVNELKASSNLWNKEFLPAVQGRLDTMDEGIQEQLDELREYLAEHCAGCDVNDIFEFVETIRDYEQEKAKITSYESYIEFTDLKTKELNIIRKRNLTRKRKTKLANVQ